MKKNILFLFLVVLLVSTSCSDNSNGNENDEAILPDLVFSYSVTGHINQSDDWESPGNNPELAGHTRGVISNHSTSIGVVNMSGAGPEYTFAVRFEAPNVEQGTYSIGNATFSDGQNSFATFQSGTIRIDEAEINFTANGQAYYTISGSFSAEIKDGFTPPNSITFTSDFTGLSVASN